MALTAQQVHDMQFKLVRQSTGYDVDEVDAFLDEVEAEIIRLNDELANALAGSEDAKAANANTAQVADPSGSESVTRAASILDLAQKTADDYLAQALRTADSLVSEAQERARAAIAALDSQRSELESRVGSLRSMEADVRTRLTGYFEAQLNDLRSSDG